MRLGAVMVAFGLSCAFAHLAVAWADSSATDAGGDSTTSQANPSPSTKDAPPLRPGAAASPATSVSASGGTDTRSPSSSENTSSTSRGDESSFTAAHAKAGDDSAKTTVAEPHSTKPHVKAALRSTSGRSDDAPVDSTPSQPLKAPAVTVHNSATTAAVAMAPKASAVAPIVSSAPSTATVTSTAPTVKPAATSTVSTGSLLARLLAAVGLGPSAGTAPAPAAQTPVLFAVLGWVRREFENFENIVGSSGAPSATPTQLAADTVGARVVQGALNALGPNGDPVKYTVTQQPSDGTVTVNSNGTYLYTPNADFSPAGGTDTFTVTVTDAGFHLANLLGAPAGAISVPVQVDVAPLQVQSSSHSTFELYNFTQYDVRLNGYDSGTRTSTDDIYWAPGTVLQPGQALQFSLNNTDFSSGGASYGDYFGINLTSLDPAQSTTWDVALEVWNPGFGNDALTTCSVKSSNGSSCSPTPNTGIATDTYNVILMDKPGTVVTVPPSESQQESEVLDNLCGGEATCTFSPTSFVQTMGNPHTPTQYNPIVNDTSLQQSTDYTVTDTAQVDASYTVSDKVSANLSAAVKEEVTVQYGQTWTNSQQYTYDLTLPIPPHTVGTLTATDPVDRYTGDFTVKVGNTTWDLQGVVVDDPIPGAGTFTFTTPPITSTTPAAGTSAAVTPTTLAITSTGNVPTPAPTPTPSPNPLNPVAAVLDWARRELAYTFGGSRLVTIRPTQVDASAYAPRQVTGTLNAAGPNGDPLTFAVAQQPADGTVQINADGSYTYTPNADFPAAGGTDTFTVMATDAATHLANLLGTPRSSVTAPVTVTVAALATASSSSSTSAYTFTNMTGHNLVVYATAGPNNPTGAIVPTPGLVLAPGASFHGQLNNGDGANTSFYAQDSPTKTVQWGVQYETNSGGGFGTLKCSEGTCTTSGSTLTLLDPPGSSVVYDASQDPGQSIGNSILDNLCGTGLAVCEFVATGFENNIYGDQQIAGGTSAIDNQSNPPVNITQTYTATDTVQTKQSWSVSSATTTAITPTVSNTITTTYGVTLTDTLTYSQKLTVVVPSGVTTTIYYTEPVDRYFGTWVVSYANTVVELQNTYADYPSGEGNGEYLLQEVPNS